MAKEPEGVVYSSKNPSPKASPKSFVWPPRESVTEEQRQKVAASLQELLPPKNWTHVQLARTLFGAAENGQIRRIGVARAWLLGKGPFLTEEEAGWTADLLGVSMARLLEPKSKFNPEPGMIRKKSKVGEGPFSKAKRPHKQEDDVDDGRWTLPKGVAAPHIVMATLKDRAGFALLELNATVPDDVAQAIYSMLKCKPARET